MQLLAAVFNLNGRAPYVHWHFFEMSAANVSVIGAMLIVFVLAILLPFPGSGRRARKARRAGGANGRPRPGAPPPSGSGSSPGAGERAGAEEGLAPPGGPR